MSNAKEEFVEHTAGNEVLCATINNQNRYCYDEEEDDGTSSIKLNVDYSESDYIKFLNQLDFEYDDGYGGQELFGTIWYKNGTWSSRGEYDGSEWWEHYQVPEIPNYLKEVCK